MRRHLRIAFSATCGIICLLLIVLSVRSYWQGETVWRISSTRIYTRLASDCGTLSLSRDDKTWGRNLYIQVVAEKDRWHYRAGSASKKLPWFGWRVSAGEVFVRIPYWVVLLGLMLIGAAPWFRWRFTLRTLLIATAVVAIMLGIILALSP
jgi:hypothetical protein